MKIFLQTSKTNYTILKIDYQTVQQNNRLVNSITKINEQADVKGSSLQNRLVHFSVHDFYIDTDVATYMENEDGTYHSYTFPIIRNNPTVALENILFSLQADGTYKVSLVSYDLSESEKDALLNGQNVDLTNKTAIEDIDETGLTDNVFTKAAIGCADFVLTYCSCTDVHPGGYFPNGNPCDCYNIQVYTVCYGGGGGDGTDNPDNSDIPDGGGGSSGSGSPTDSNNDATSPTYNIPYEQNLIECLELDQVENANLPVSNWINNPDNFSQMRDASNLCNADNQDFIIEAIETILEGGDVDFNDIIYVLENEQDYRNRMSDDELALFDTLSTIQQIKYLASAKEASDKTEELFETDCEKHNGKGDAFRHALWNALSSSRIGVGLTNLLTTRHENNPPIYPYNNKENQMDLFNNQVGRDIFANGSTNILQDTLEAFNNGELRYLSNQALNCWATFSSQLTPTNQ